MACLGPRNSTFEERRGPVDLKKRRGLQPIGLFLPFLLGMGVEGSLGIMMVPGNPARNWNNSIPSPPILNPQHLLGGWEMLLWTLGTSWQPFLHCHCPSGQAHRRLGSIGSEGMSRYADVPPFQPPRSPQGNVAFATERSFQRRKDKARRQPAEDEVWGRRKGEPRGEPTGPSFGSWRIQFLPLLELLHSPPCKAEDRSQPQETQGRSLPTSLTFAASCFN